MRIERGFWNCCQALPGKAVRFIRDADGSDVWHEACNGCASTVSADRVADLPDGYIQEPLLSEMVTAYLETGLWSESCNGTAEHKHAYEDRPEDCDTPLQSIGFTPDDMSDSAMVKAEADCADFISAIAAERPEAFAVLDARMLGHDFWLTRNGHGCGFWDRGLGELGDWLTALSRPYGETSMWVRGDLIVELES